MGDEQNNKPPRMIGDYEILREIGSGGMATVYAALQKRPKRTVALKIVKATGQPAVAVRRFRREVDILGRLNHPYIAQIFDAGTHDDGNGAVPYLVMEYVSGGRTILEHAAAASLDLRQRLMLFARVCAAVEHGHRRKIIHRDLKPGSILIDTGGEPKVIDFGVARALEVDVSAQTMATEAGHLVGTIQYMAPEQVDSKLHNLTPRCDVYALGVLLYKLMTGQFPYDLGGLPVYVAAQAIREEIPRRPSALNDALAGDVETIILKALDKDPARRYRSAGSLGRDIVRYLGSKPIHARRAAPLYRLRLFAARHRVMVAGAGAALIVLLGAAAVLVASQVRRAADEKVTAAEIAALTETVEQREAALRTLRDTAAAAPPEAPAEPAGFVLREQIGRIVSLAFDRTGTRLVTGSRDHTWALWDLPAQRLVHLFDQHERPVRDVAFSGDGSLVVAAAGDGTIVITDVRSAAALHHVDDTCDEVHCLAVDPSGDRLAFGCSDLTLRIRGLLDATSTLKRGTTGAFHSAAWSADGGRLAAGSQGGAVYVWTMDDNGAARRIDELQGRVIAVGFDTEGTRLVAVDEQGRAFAWNTATGAVIKRFSACRERPRAVAFDPTGRWMAAAGSAHVEVLDMTTLERQAEVATNDGVFSVAIDPTGSWCAVGLADGEVELLRIDPD